MKVLSTEYQIKIDMKKATESKLQQEMVMWFNKTYCLKIHEPRCVVFSVPNEMAMQCRAMMTANGMSVKKADECVSMLLNTAKSTGFLGGVSDLALITPAGTVYVEVKLPTNNQQPNQIEFQSRVESLNQRYIVVKTLSDFKAFCETFISKPSIMPL